VTSEGETHAPRRFSRAREHIEFVRALVRRQPKTFAIAVGGAFLFAVLTVASSIVIRWVIDNVILPRFDEGEVAVGTVVAGAGLIIGIGVVRAVVWSCVARSPG
jgi:ATP-binding cassette, subfamily B, bacterial